MIRAVIPSVDYADMLAETLPAVKAWLPAGAAILVVTSRDDVATQEVAAAEGVGCLPTPAWRHDGARFNKAFAIDEAFGFIGETQPEPGAICVSLDADAYPCGSFPDVETIRDGTLYGVPRYTCVDTETLDAVTAGRRDPRSLPLRNSWQKVGGYCQVFRYRPGIRYGSWPDAGHYDLAFHQHFDARAPLPGCYVLHLGQTTSKNWHGHRVLPRWGRAS